MRSDKIELKVHQNIDWYNSKTSWVVQEMDSGSDVSDDHSSPESAFEKMNSILSSESQTYFSSQSFEDVKNKEFTFN